MAKRRSKEQKELEYAEIAKKIKDGELEVISYNGTAPAWKMFFKIRLVNDPTKYVDYVQCKTCKVVRFYMAQNGTTTLGKHQCKIDDIDEEDEIFEAISPEAANEIKTILLQKSMELCANDIISAETISGTGFLKYAQSLVAIGEKHRKINLEGLLPNKIDISRHIKNFKDEEELKAKQSFTEAMKKKYCSLAVNWNTVIDGNRKLSVNVIYFNNDLTTLTKKILFTTTVDVECNVEKFKSDIQNKFKAFGCDEEMLKNIKVVTPKKGMFAEILNQMCSRIDCTAFIINSVLKAFVDENEISDILYNCKAIVIYLKHTKKNEKLTFKVVEDIGTWKSKFDMINGLNSHYNEVMNLLGAEKQNQWKYNIKVAEQLLSALANFVEAIDDLQSTTCTTSNKILLYWSLLRDHLNSTTKYSKEVKRAMTEAKSLFEQKFVPTMDQKIACFLDPRFRLLKMLTAEERDEVIASVRVILNDIPAKPIAAEPGPAPRDPPAKKSKFSHLEAKEDDTTERDEVDSYIHTIQLKTYNLEESEFNIVGRFWKENQTKLPKLFEVATTKLHTPASCCSGETTFSKKIIDPEMVDNLLFIRDKFPSSRKANE